MISADRPATRLATRLAFFVAGFGIACWVPLVPIVKHRLGVDDGTLGLLLLCLGIGSVIAMLVTGTLAARYGSKLVILAGGLGLAVILPFLSAVGAPLALALLLLLFGASLGSLDVAMNIHAVEVEQAAGKTLMSGFHALFSIGGFAGAGLMTALLSLGLTAQIATSFCALLMLVAMLVAWPRLLLARVDHATALFFMPSGIVLLLGLLSAVTFLVEGAMLDWSALLVIGRGFVAKNHGGIGYILFASMMVLGRLIGDRVTARLGDAKTMLGGGILAIMGFVLLLTMPIPIIAMAGFLLIGLGVSNIVPVLFHRAGAQTSMPAPHAIGAISMTGYAGILIGPAVIGFVAKGFGLPTAFWLLAALLCLVPATARAITRVRPSAG